MKMLFFSSEREEVEQVRKEFVEAGIPCEVRDRPPEQGEAAKSSDTELWIKNDGDSHKARLLCVHLGVGFGKPAPRPQIEEEPQDQEEPNPEEGSGERNRLEF